MRINNFKSIMLVLFIITLSNCASVKYVGQDFEPTTDIEVFYSAKEITGDYAVIGHALGVSLFVSPDKIREKLETEAREKGANAVLIQGIAKGEVLITTGFATPESQVQASFIKYKK